MNDIQKAIDEFIIDLSSHIENQVIQNKALKQLKSLLEQVAKEQRQECYKESVNPAPLVTDNLTFNED